MDAGQELQVGAVLAAHAQTVRATCCETISSWQGFDLTVTQLKVLVMVANHRSLAMGQLARKAAVSRSGITSAVDQLVQRKLVARTRDPHRRQRVLVCPTEQGTALLESLFMGDPALLRARLERLDAAELHALTQGLHALIQAIGADSP